MNLWDMNKKIIAVFATALMALLPLVSATTSPILVKEVCLNHTTEYANFNYSVSIDGIAEEYGYEQYKECLNGCSASIGKCRPDEFREVLYGGGIILGLTLLALFTYYVGRWYALFLVLVLLTTGLMIYSTDFFTTTLKYMVLVADVALIGIAVQAALRPASEDDE